MQQELEGKASDAALAKEKLKAKGESLDKRETDLARREKDLAFREEMLTRGGELLAEHKLEAEKKKRARGPGPPVQRGTGDPGFPSGGGHQEGPRGSSSGAPHRGPAHRRMGRRGKHNTGAANDESHPGVRAADVYLRRAPDAGLRRRLPPTPGQILGARLEAEGSRLCLAVIDYILTCFRSHDPAISLEPLIAGPVAATEDPTREGVQDAVELVAKRFQRDPTDDE
jgi:hypothetical protein